MKKFLIIIGAAALLAGFVAIQSGCGSQAAAGTANLSKDKYDQIQVGMNGDQAKKIAGGDPARTESKTMSGSHQMGGMTMSSDMSVEYWYYQGSKGWVRIEVTQGTVSGKSGY